jgi:hypothetical protein
MKLRDSSVKVDTKTTRLQEIFYETFLTFSPGLTLLKINTIISFADASAILRTNVCWLSPMLDTWPDSQKEANSRPPSEREAVGLIKNRGSN